MCYRHRTALESALNSRARAQIWIEAIARLCRACKFESSAMFNKTAKNTGLSTFTMTQEIEQRHQR